MRIWRISNHADLRGLGGLRAGGRWHYQGQPVVYCAENPAAALLEILVHLECSDFADLPDAYRLLEIEVQDSISPLVWDAASLPENWRHRTDATQTIGTRWLRERQSALLWVPSAIVPHTNNVLVNPLHPDTQLLRIVTAEHYPFDHRLLKNIG